VYRPKKVFYMNEPHQNMYWTFQFSPKNKIKIKKLYQAEALNYAYLYFFYFLNWSNFWNILLYHLLQSFSILFSLINRWCLSLPKHNTCNFFLSMHWVDFFHHPLAHFVIYSNHNVFLKWILTLLFICVRFEPSISLSFISLIPYSFSRVFPF